MVLPRDPNRIPSMGAVNDSTGLVDAPYVSNTTHGLYTQPVGTLIGTPVCGQAKIAVTATAVQLPSNILVNGVIITAKSTNSANILIGSANTVTRTEDGTGNGTILEPGASLSFAVTNTNTLYINGAANDIVSFSGS